MEKIDQILETLYDRVIEPMEAKEQLLDLFAVSGSLPSDDRIVAEAIQAARKVDTEVGLLPSNNDIKMFCLGAKWMRDLAQGNDR
jgi:hypothetical protein